MIWQKMKQGPDTWLRWSCAPHKTPRLSVFQSTQKLSMCLILVYVFSALRCAGRRRRGRPASAQPAPTAHAQPKTRVVEVPRQAAVQRPRRRPRCATQAASHRPGSPPLVSGAQTLAARAAR